MMTLASKPLRHPVPPPSLQTLPHSEVYLYSMVHFYFTARKNDFDRLLTAAASLWLMAAEVHLFWPTLYDQISFDCPRVLPQKSWVACATDDHPADCHPVGCDDTVYVYMSEVLPPFASCYCLMTSCCILSGVGQ